MKIKSTRYLRISCLFLTIVYQEVEELSLLERPNIYCHFGQGFGEPKYMPVSKWSTISQLLEEALASYNDLVAGMNLVLFEDAMLHICRYENFSNVPIFL